MTRLTAYIGSEATRLTTPLRLGIGLFICGAAPIFAAAQWTLSQQL